MTNLVLYFLLLLGGILFLVAGLFVARSSWRTDIEPFGRRSRPFQIALHPENYVRAERLGQIRLLNLAGGICLVGALVVVVRDIIASVAGR